MKKYLASVLVVGALIPSVCFAQDDTETLKLIAALQEQVKELQAQLAILQAATSTNLKAVDTIAAADTFSVQVETGVFERPPKEGDIPLFTRFTLDKTYKQVLLSYWPTDGSIEKVITGGLFEKSNVGIAGSFKPGKEYEWTIEATDTDGSKHVDSGSFTFPS
jgi:hypothetical protein